MKNIFFYSSTNMHNMYTPMLANVPEGFRYKKEEFLAMPMRSNNLAKSFFEKVIWKISPYYNYFKVLQGNPKIRKFYIENYDLIHSTQSLLETNLPYVVDFEHAAVFSGYNQIAFSNEKFIKNLKKILENRKLKKLLPFTNAAKMSLLNFVKSKEIEEKTEVVYLFITPPKKIKKKDDRIIKFLFIGKAFFEKGGLETLEAFNRISLKYDVELTLVSNAPEDIKIKYEKNAKIKIMKQLPDSEVQKLYEESNVFVFPTHYDTVGFVILEAMSYGLPIITDNSFSRPEIVENEKTGLLINAYYSSFGKNYGYLYPTSSELSRKRKEACMHPPEWYVNDLSKAMERFVLDSELRNKCSKNARKECTEGKFSPKVWKEKIKKIYTEAGGWAP